MSNTSEYIPITREFLESKNFNFESFDTNSLWNYLNSAQSHILKQQERIAVLEKEKRVLELKFKREQLWRQSDSAEDKRLYKRSDRIVEQIRLINDELTSLESELSTLTNTDNK